MKKRNKVLIIILSIIVFAVIGISILLNTLLPKALQINNTDLATVLDGTHIGEYDNGIVSAEVKVTTADHQITDIEILKHVTGLGQPAEKIIESIIDKQSLDVDAISGATYSSNTILKAVENALNGQED